MVAAPLHLGRGLGASHWLSHETYCQIWLALAELYKKPDTETVI